LKSCEEAFNIEIDGSMNIKANPFYTPFFVLKDKTLSLPMCYGDNRTAFRMEDEVIEIVEKQLIPKGLIKKVITEQRTVDYYKENAIEVFVLDGSCL